MPGRPARSVLPSPTRPSVHHRFFRRREAWLPTVWGWLALLLMAALLLLAYGRFAEAWLSVDEPAQGPGGGGASTLVVEGWLGPGDLNAALQTFRQGHYQRLVTTGGPDNEWPDPEGFGNYADRAADYLRRHGMPADRLVAAPAPEAARDRTYTSAIMVRDWALHTGTRLDAIDVFSVGPHTRRSRMVYRLAFGPSVEIGAIAARPYSYDADRWWTSSAGVKSVIGETLSIAWTVCCFWPPRAGSTNERPDARHGLPATAARPSP